MARSNIYEQLRKSDAVDQAATPINSVLQSQIREIVACRPTYGYRRVAALLRRQTGHSVNHKRVYRVMRAMGLLLARHTGRPCRSHTGQVITLHRNTRWCTDAFGIRCDNGEQLQIAFSMDCCDREVISWVVSTRGIDGELVRDLMTDSVERRFGKSGRVPQGLQWLSDNGPGYTARQTVLFGRTLGLDIRTTPPYSPESNGMAEAFVKTFKRDYVYVSNVSSAACVLAQITSWFDDYNEHAPHKGLRMMSPRQYIRSLNLAA